MTEEWGCPHGHRWEHPDNPPTPLKQRADHCPVCGAHGAPTLNARGLEAATRQILPPEPAAPPIDATLLPPAAQPPARQDQTLLGSSNAARSLKSAGDGAEAADGTVKGGAVLPSGMDSASSGGSGYVFSPAPPPTTNAPRMTRPGSNWSGASGSREATRPSIAGYEVLSVLGRGAMGVVYKARHLTLNRVVALKMILAGEHAGEEDFFRFRTEAQSVAELQHPNIVQIYEVGEAEGRPYFSLEFVDGGGLDQKIGGKPLPVLEAARIVEALARAMQLAHQRGILHRDLKSANVLVSKDGVPKITDFGLAKRLDQDSGRTGTGSILGTPSYMSPEQAQGKTHELGPAVDIYALGAILYDCLTGRPPFAGESILDTLMQVETSDPVPPSHLQPKVPTDLETICLKCLQKDPHRRYASALELAEDLARFLRGEPIHARPITVWERMAKWAKRRPAVAALACLMSTMVLSALVLLSLWWREAETRSKVESDLRTQAEEETEKAKKAEEEAKSARATAEQEQARTRAALEKSNRTLYAGGINLAQEAFREGRIPTLQAFLKQKDIFDPFRKFEWTYLEQISSLRLAKLRGHVHGVQRVVFRPPSFEHLASASADGSIVIWNPGKVDSPAQHILRHDSEAVTQLAFSVDGTLLASGGRDGAIYLWDVEKGERLRKWNLDRRYHKQAITSLAFSLDGKLVASGGEDGSLCVWSPDSDAPRAQLNRHRYPVTGLAFSPRDSNRLASVGEDKTLRLWDVQAGEETSAQSYKHWLTCVAFSPAADFIAVGGWDPEVHLQNLKTGEQFTLDIRQPVEPSGPSVEQPEPIKQLGFSPNAVAPLLAVQIRDGSIRVFNIERRRPINDIPRQDGVVRSIAFSTDGHQIASINFLRLVPDYFAYANPEAVLALSATDQAQYFLAGGANGGLYLWDLTKKQAPIWSETAHKGPVRALTHTQDAYFSGDEDGLILRWTPGKDYRTWHRQVFGKQETRIIALAADRAGSRLACAEAGKDITLWDLRKSGASQSLQGHNAQVTSLSFAPGGAFLLSGDTDGKLIVWEDARKIGEHDFKTRIRSLAATSLGAGGSEQTLIAVGLEDHGIRLFFLDARGSLQAPATLKGHSGAITCLAFTPDGSRLVSGSEDKMVKIWDPQSGQEILTFKGHTQTVVGLAFSPDGRRLLSADLSGMLLRWEPEE